MANNEEIFEEWNSYAKRQALKERAINLEDLEKNSKLKIISITGVRRAGKSSILMLLLQKLSGKGKKTAYINLEDSRIKNDGDILNSILKWFGGSGYLLLDEITSVNDWEGWLARNHEMLKGRLNLIVSSSRSSLILPPKSLRGRMLPYELFPLSFDEFLKFKGAKVEKTIIGMGMIEKALQEYLIFGGYPEIALTSDKTSKVQLLDTYFKDIVGLDIAEISGEEISIVDAFARCIIESTHFSASKCLNFFKSMGYKIGKQSILNLEKYAQLSYLFFFVPIFSNKIKDRLQYTRKVFLGDTGFIYALSGKTDMGKLFENAVFLELKRRKKITQEINYWKNKDGIECDFIIREGFRINQAIQVVFEIKDEKSRQREVNGIINCAKEFNLKEGLIITKDYESREMLDGIKIKFVPLWKWLLLK